jgi:PhnB protein
MQVNPYLFFNGNCEEALKYYQKALGAQIEAMMPYGDGPAEMPIPADWKTKIMHSRITIDGEVLMASDATPGDYHQPQGFSVALAIENPAEAERRFNALAEGGTVRMPFGKTFFSNGFGMCVDKFGIPWMVNCRRKTCEAIFVGGRRVGKANGSVPTMLAATKMVGTAQGRLCPPYEILPAPRIDRANSRPRSSNSRDVNPPRRAIHWRTGAG